MRILITALVASVAVTAVGVVKADEPLLKTSLAPLKQYAAVMSCTDWAHQTTNSHVTVVDAALQRSESGADWCQVTALVHEPNSRSDVKVWVGLPQKWNGRLLGTSGGGYLGGSTTALVEAVSEGFVGAATDAGHGYPAGKEEAAVFDGSFALDAEGALNRDAVKNFAHAGIHQMTVVAKEFAQIFYKETPAYSYFVGCSTGGRQGQSEVQRYPGDYDGVLSGAPAINWTHFLPAAMWGKVVMNETHHVVAQCKLEIARKAAIERCDAIDGVVDGVLGRPDLCHFSAKEMTGKKVAACGEVTKADAAVIDKIWDGPRNREGRRLWFGLPYGATFDFDTGGDPRKPDSYDGTPSPISVDWFRYFLLRDPQWLPSKLDRATFERLFQKSVEDFGEVFDTSSTDLTAFWMHGGKTIIWHGLADSNFPAEGTLKYVDEVRNRLGEQATDGFLRAYVAPSVGHCGGGEGPQPIELLDALVDWVEHGKPPEAISGEVRGEDGKVKSAWTLNPYRGAWTTSLAKRMEPSHVSP